MISMDELLNHKYKLENCTDTQKKNLPVLLERVNKVRLLWDKPMTVTSGLRSVEDHLRIYAAKGITDVSKIPMMSRHLSGAAVDIADEGLILTAWLKEYPHILENSELWCEDGNKNWVHFQIVPPLSGKRWFLP